MGWEKVVATTVQPAARWPEAPRHSGAQVGHSEVRAELEVGELRFLLFQDAPVTNSRGQGFGRSPLRRQFDTLHLRT